MKRNIIGSSAYWNKWASYSEHRIESKEQGKREYFADEGYRAQYIYDLAKLRLRLMLERYSRGDPVSELPQHFVGLLDAWEESERLGKEVWSEQEQRLRHYWPINLHFYMDCFWLIGLAITLDIPEDQWERLLVLVGNAGHDVLLDRVVASRQAGRKIGGSLCFPKAYKGLLQVVDAPSDEQPLLLRVYLDNWYGSLKNAGFPESEPFLRTPYWYTYGDENFEGGAYLGRWCIEAAAVAKVFGIDDTLCLDHPNYPGDLLQDGRCPRYSDPESSVEVELTQAPVNPARGLFWRLFKN